MAVSKRTGGAGGTLGLARRPPPPGLPPIGTPKFVGLKPRSLPPLASRRNKERHTLAVTLPREEMGGQGAGRGDSKCPGKFERQIQAEKPESLKANHFETYKRARLAKGNRSSM